MTFLGTDIERSTAGWESAGEGFRTVLACHHALLRREFDRYRGYEIKETGDGFLVVFVSARDALECAAAGQRALAAQEWPAEVGPVRTRMVLHTGGVTPEHGDYHGPVLNRLSRLLAVAHGGQALLSGATQELVQDDLPPGASLRDLGRHRLRDLQRPEQIFQLLHPDLPAPGRWSMVDGHGLMTGAGDRKPSTINHQPSCSSKPCASSPIAPSWRSPPSP